MGTSSSNQKDDATESAGKIEQLIDLIIRPPKCAYNVSELGPARFMCYDKHFFRTDFTLQNDQNQKICVSVWEPELADRPEALMDYIIYLHGNCGCRLGVIPYLSLFFSRNCCVCALDTRGAGLSEGKYITLGLKECDDVIAVMKHLKEERAANNFILYGHSSGAVTAINTAARHPNLAGIVCDCPFSDLGELCIELANLYVSKFFNLAIRGARYILDNSIQKKAGFKLTENKPIESAKQCECPCLLLYAERDEIIKKHHAEDIKKGYKGDCQMIAMDCGHNDQRSNEVYVEIASFIMDCFDNKVVFNVNYDQLQKSPWGDILNIQYFEQMTFDPHLLEEQVNRRNRRRRNRPEMEDYDDHNSVDRMMMDMMAHEQYQDIMDSQQRDPINMPQADWDCPQCTLHNNMNEFRCVVCQYQYGSPL